MGSRDRVLQQYGDRLYRVVQQAKDSGGSNLVPVQYSGSGEVKPLGAAGGIPARANQSTGSLSIGQPVGNSQGLIQGIPNAVQADELSATLSQLTDLLASVRNQVGLKIIDDVDPNDGSTFSRHSYDRTYDKTKGVEYWWEPSTSSVPGQWQPMRQILISTAAPTVAGAHNGAIAIELPNSGSPSIYVYREFSDSWENLSSSSGTEKEEINGLIAKPKVQSYRIIQSCRYRTQVIGLFGNGAVSASLSVANNGFIEVGDALDLTISVLSTDDPYAFTVELLRVEDV